MVWAQWSGSTPPPSDLHSALPLREGWQLKQRLGARAWWVTRWEIQPGDLVVELLDHSQRIWGFSLGVSEVPECVYDVVKV